MKKSIAIISLLAVVGCDGNPFIEPTDGGGGGTDNQDVVVPDSLKVNVQRIVYRPGTSPANSTLQVQIAGVDATPTLATWDRRPSLDVKGFTAFAVQEDALDRLFIGLAGQSADGSVRATVAGDGGQFNTYFAGSSYERTGGFTPPRATSADPGTGQVSYGGNYAGLLNGGGDGSALLTPPAGTDPEQLPAEAARVTGQGFINANFADDTVNGVIFDRVIVGSGFGLESVILVPTTITSNGTFVGTAERPRSITDANVGIGDYGGVFGGTNAAAVAGAVSLDQVYDTNETLVTGAQEHGVFILNQCGIAGQSDAPSCAGTAP